MFPSRITTVKFVNKGTVTIDSTALAACIAAYNQTATTCASIPLTAACTGVFVGTKAENEPCGIGGVPGTSGVSECKASGGPESCVWTGDSNDPAVTGVCQKIVRGKNGDPCASSCASGQDCSFDVYGSSGPAVAVCFEDDGLYCAFGSSESACAPIVAQGGSCAADSSSCASTTYCDYTTSKCKASGTIGQSCASLGSMCLSELVCGLDRKCADPGLASESACTGIPPAPY